jgi:glycosyltransferase involved in cell wall biosynthesis
MKHVCFISLKSYDLLSDNPHPNHIGGAERQQVLVARGLQQIGYRVSFVTLDVGQADGIEHNGIRVFKAYHPGHGLPMIRFVSPRWTGLCAALSRADADIYHQMCADSETGQVALWCRRNGRHFVFAVASDTDCEKHLPRIMTGRERWLYRYGLARADQVVTQTITQKNMLKQNFGMDSTIIASCTGNLEHQPAASPRFPKSDEITLVWVSRIVPLKRLEWLLDLAETCPNYRFQVVGGGDESAPYVQQISSRARKIKNVQLLGRISDRELWSVYERADLLLDTASVAGVPTTFLEAWARGVPVVSTVDPDGILGPNNLGRAVSNTREMGEAVAEFIKNPDSWLECSRAARAYYKKFHTVEAVGVAYDRLFSRLGTNGTLGSLGVSPAITSQFAGRTPPHPRVDRLSEK